MKAFVFPGQGAQYVGMGHSLYQGSELARSMFERAKEILGFDIGALMFHGTDEDLKQTKVTQPSVFLHSVILAALYPDFQPDMVAGHSLGEFSALVAAKALSFEDGLRLVAARAVAMQKACELQSSTMAAVLGLEDEIVQKACSEVEGVVVPANYNSPGQVVISGEVDAVAQAGDKLKAAGAKRVLPLKVGGAFHSPLMEPARKELAEAIEAMPFAKPICPIFQNVDAQPHQDPEKIKENLVLQLTSPVRWTQTVKAMLAAGANEFIELGPGNVLQGLIKKVSTDVTIKGYQDL